MCKHSCDLGLEERPIVKIYGPLKLAHHQLLCSTAWPSCLVQIVNYPNGLHMFHKCSPRTNVHYIKCKLTTQDTIILSSMHNCCKESASKRSLKAFNMFAERKHSSWFMFTFLQITKQLQMHLSQKFRFDLTLSRNCNLSLIIQM